MIRLHVLTEGETEKKFVRDVLSPWLAPRGIFADAKSLLTRRDRNLGKVYKGGLISFGKAKKELNAWFREDRSAQCRFTTMFDFYALPHDFPGLKDLKGKKNPYEQVNIVEKTFAKELKDQRFIPYIQLHEFEALILAEPERLKAIYFDYLPAIDRLIAQIAGQDPELVNDGKLTAPSKRILNAIPVYNKAVDGPALIKDIGVESLKSCCPHFAQWLSRLEKLSEFQ